VLLSRYLAAPLLVAAFLASSLRPCGAEELRFPVPDRPVAATISSAYALESARDKTGEAKRVMDRLAIKPGLRVGDIGAGQGYYTVRLARRLGGDGIVYAQDVEDKFLKSLEARLKREKIQGVKVVLGTARDPKLAQGSIDVAILSHVYHEIENPYEFMYRLRPSLAANARVAIIDNNNPTEKHGTPLALLRCELGALGYRQVDFLLLTPADGYLAVFVPPDALPAVESIKPCKQ
jgi:predicted methyltransferase